MALLDVTVVTPKAALPALMAKNVSLFTCEGEVTILPLHAAYLGALAIGVVTIDANEAAVDRYFVTGGFVEVNHDAVKILAHSAIRVEDIDLTRAERDVAAATSRLAHLGPEHPDFMAQQARLQRAQGRVAAVQDESRR